MDAMATENDETIENLPRPTTSGNAQTGAVIRDSRGIAFDPEKHKHTIDPDGTKSPELGKTGRFLLIKRRDRIAKARRRPLGRSPLDESTSAMPLEIPYAEEPDEDEFKATAGIVVEMIEAAAVMLLSSNCKMDAETRRRMTIAYTSYFRAKGIVDVPPSLMVISTTGIYIGKSIASEPEARSKIKRGVKWIASRARRLQGTQLLTQEPPPDAPPAGREGGDISQEAGTAQSTNQ